MSIMRRLWVGFALAVLAPQALAPAAGAPIPVGIGLALELERNASAQVQERALAEVRATGVNVFALPLSWSAAEPAEGKYDLSDFVRAARSLRQSGATLHLDLSVVAGNRRDVPADLERLGFDDERFASRLGGFLTALEPALLDATTLSLGFGADAYFADRKEEFSGFRRLFNGTVDFLKKRTPHLLVGVTTAAPTESPAPLIGAALAEKSSVLFFVYAPFRRANPFLHRSPDAIAHDWKLLLERSAGRPIAFPEVSYSSSPENGSSPERQAEFIGQLRRFLGASDGRRLLFVRYATWRDAPAERLAADSSVMARRKAAFYANRGLQTADGQPKPAWREWVKAGK
jgi:hypothetical protein